MTLVGTGPASHANIHKHAERPILVQSLAHTFEDDLLPVVGQFPVFLHRLPFAHMRQAKVFQFMPIIFTVFFLFFPAGLVLYWLVNNVLSMAQQWIITRQIERTP